MRAGRSCSLAFLVWSPVTGNFLSLFAYRPTVSMMEDIRALSTPCPMYFRDDSALFFAQLESDSEIRGIGNQKAKYHLPVSRLPTKVLWEVRQLIVLVSKEMPFSKLRNKLIKRMSPSQQERSS